MKKMNATILLAALPVLFLTLDLWKAFWIGAVTTLSYWLTLLFFHLTAALFPKRLLLAALLLWLAALAQVVWDVRHLNPLWVASVFWLVHQDFLDRSVEEKLSSQIVWTGFNYWLLLIGLGGFQEILGRQLGWSLFQKPAGTFLVLALISWAGATAGQRTHKYA